MAQSPKIKNPKSVSSANRNLSLFGPECGWAAAAIVLLCGVVGILLTCLTLADAESGTLARFLRGFISISEMMNTSIFWRMFIGLMLGGVGGFMFANSLPRPQLARLKFEAMIVLIILPVVLIYIPAMTAGFIWDDDQEITANPSLRSVHGLWEIWTGAKSADYFPLKTTMLWAEYQFWGIDAPGYHIVNIILHAIDSVLVWIVLRRLGIPGAWLAGLVFGIHPVHVESVGWIAERKNTLSTFFYLLSLLAYFDFEDKNRARSYVLALVFFLAGMLCKTHVVVLPFVLLLLAWWRHGFSGLKSDRVENAGERSLLQATNCIVGGLGILLSVAGLFYFMSWNHRFHLANDNPRDPVIFATHMFKKGHLDNEFWFLVAICFASSAFGIVEGVFGQRYNKHLLRTLAFFQIAVLLGAVTVFFQYGRAIGDEDIPIGGMMRRFAGAGWAVWWYLLKSVAPVHLNTIYSRWPITPPAFYEFLPLLILIVVMIRLWLGRNGWKRIPFFVMTYFVITLLPVMGFLKMSYLRLNVLVADHFQYISDIAVIAALCAGVDWIWKKAASELRPAIVGVGALLLSAMMIYSWDRAHIYQGEETLWRDTLSKNEDTWQGHNHIGAVLFTQGSQLEQQARAFEQQQKPQEAAAYHAASRQKYQEATTNFARAVELKPDNPESHNNLGLGYCTAGRIDEGIVEYRRAVQIKGDEPSMRTNLANALAGVASTHLQNAQKLQQEHKQAEAEQEGQIARQRFEEAIIEYREVLKLDQQEQTNAPVHLNLGVALMNTGHVDDAVKEFQKAKDIDPNMPQAQQNLNAVMQQRTQEKLIASMIATKLKATFAALPASVQASFKTIVEPAIQKIDSGDIGGARNDIISAKLDPSLEPTRQQLLQIFTNPQ